MNSERGAAGAWLRRRLRLWPWALIAAATYPAIYHSTVFPDDVERDFPRIVRPTFSRRPPPAYRLAEPGDTIDRVGVYASSAVLLLGLAGWLSSRRAGQGDGLWPAALGVALIGGWNAATPWPTFDGWHGLNWRAVADPTAPVALRLVLAIVGLGLLGVILGWSWAARPRWHELVAIARRRGAVGLLIAAAVLISSRLVEFPGVEPVGYWPRWSFAWGMMALGLTLVRLQDPPRGWRRWATVAAMAGVWFAMIAGGRWLIWYHRPLERLKTVVPGRIYISAMPTYRGLAIAHRRNHFRTIINIFNEDTDQRSPLLPDELRFAREHGIRFVASPNDALASDAFLDETLRMAQDPSSWPILVHCHGSMDRSPAWMGIYRFVVEGRPLDAILREIEAHRGSRPKAGVTLLYNRVLAARAPERFAADPTARLLVKCAEGTEDPYYQQVEAARRRKASIRR